MERIKPMQNRSRMGPKKNSHSCFEKKYSNHSDPKIDEKCIPMNQKFHEHGPIYTAYKQKSTIIQKSKICISLDRKKNHAFFF